MCKRSESPIKNAFSWSFAFLLGNGRTSAAIMGRPIKVSISLCACSAGFSNAALLHLG